MTIENIDKYLRNIYADADQQRMLLPKFQRGFVWNREKQKKLLASFLVDLPAGSLLCMEGKGDDFVTRELCYTSSDRNNIDNCLFVLDGQQRLSTLRSAFYDLFENFEEWEETAERIYPNLQNRWFLRLKPDEKESDIFGYKNLKLPKITSHTDEDIEDFIEFYPIYNRDVDKEHHPAFTLKDVNGEKMERPRTRVHQAKYFAEQYLVPLYETNLENRGLHRKVINNIAENRVKELQAEVEYDNYKPESIFEYLNGIKNFDSLEDVRIFIEEAQSKQGDLEQSLQAHWALLSAEWSQSLLTTINNLLNRKIPIIKLSSDETPRAIAIFEAINRGGTPLSVFDLVVAKAATNNHYDLVGLMVGVLESVMPVPRILNSSYDEDTWIPNNLNTLDAREPIKQVKEWFVNVLSLLAHLENSNNGAKVDLIKKDKILDLTAQQVSAHTQKATLGISRALAFLNIRCGVKSAQDVTYKLLVVVLAYFLSNDKHWESTQTLNKLEYWYWLAIFSGKYFYRQNEQCVEDINNLEEYLSSNINKFEIWEDAILNISDYCTKDILLRKTQEQIEPSSIRNGIMQFIISTCPNDFMSDIQSRLKAWEIARENIKIETHHIIPLTGITKLNQSTKDIRKNNEHILNSSLNFTPISKEANQAIKDRPPQDYLAHLKDSTANSHFVPEHQVALFDSEEKIREFLEVRYGLLKSGISQKLQSLKV